MSATTRNARKDRKQDIVRKYKKIEDRLEEVVLTCGDKFNRLTEKYGQEIEEQLKPEVLELITIAEKEIGNTERLREEINDLENQVLEYEDQIRHAQIQCREVRALVEIDNPEPISPLPIKEGGVKELNKKLQEVQEELRQAKNYIEAVKTKTKVNKKTNKMAPGGSGQEPERYKGVKFIYKVDVFDHTSSSQYDIIQFLADVEVARQFAPNITDNDIKGIILFRVALATKNIIRQLPEWQDPTATWVACRNALVKRFAVARREVDYRTALYSCRQREGEQHRSYADRIAEIRTYIASFHNREDEATRKAFEKTLDEDCVQVFIKGLLRHSDILRIQKVATIAQALDTLDLLDDSAKPLEEQVKTKQETFTAAEVEKLVEAERRSTNHAEDQHNTLRENYDKLATVVAKMEEMMKNVEKWQKPSPNSYRGRGRDQDRYRVNSWQDRPKYEEGRFRSSTPQRQQLAITYPGYEERSPRGRSPSPYRERGYQNDYRSRTPERRYEENRGQQRYYQQNQGNYQRHEENRGQQRYYQQNQENNQSYYRGRGDQRGRSQYNRGGRNYHNRGGGQRNDNPQPDQGRYTVTYPEEQKKNE